MRLHDLVIYLAAFLVVFFLMRRGEKKGSPLSFLPFLWVGLNLSFFLLTGFPGSLAIPTGFLPLIQVADITVIWLSFLIAMAT